MVAVYHERRGNHEIGGGAVEGNGNIVHRGQADERFYIRIVGLSGERIPEKDESVEFSFGNPRADLLVATQRTAEKTLYGKSEPGLKEAARGAGCIKMVAGKRARVERGPLDQIFLTMIVRDQHEMFYRCNFGRFFRCFRRRGPLGSLGCIHTGKKRIFTDTRESTKRKSLSVRPVLMLALCYGGQKLRILNFFPHLNGSFSKKCMTIKLKTSRAAGEASTTPAKYLFLDIVRFTQGRTVEAQADIIGSLNEIVLTALKRFNISEERRILLPTGDGMCIAILNVEIPYDVHVLLAVSILEELNQRNVLNRDEMRRFELRIGINANTDNRVVDVNGRENIAGAGINMAQRVMSMADGNQILVSASVYDTLRFREKYMRTFREIPVTVKHGEQLRVYQLIAQELPGLNTEVPSTVRSQFEMPALPRLLGWYLANAAVQKSFFKSLSLTSNDETTGICWLYFMAKDSLNQESMGEGDKSASLVFRGGSTDVRTQYQHYLKSDIRFKSQLVELFRAAHLDAFTDCFQRSALDKPDFRYLSQVGYKKLEEDWPDIYIRMKVKNYLSD